MNVFALIGVFAVIALFWMIFALKEALLEYRSRRSRPGGFEVKLNAGMPPVLLRKDNDHG